MRAAAARAAMRRGSSIRILWPASHGSSFSARGTSVVLPAPGGASSTAARCAASLPFSAGSTSSMGSFAVIGPQLVRGPAGCVKALKAAQLALSQLGGTPNPVTYRAMMHSDNPNHSPPIHAGAWRAARRAKLGAASDALPRAQRAARGRGNRDHGGAARSALDFDVARARVQLLAGAAAGGAGGAVPRAAVHDPARLRARLVLREPARERPGSGAFSAS